jgi:hypothetical protein
MSKPALEETLSKLQELSTLANMNLEEVPGRIRPAKEMLKRQAQAELPTVRSHYRSVFSQSAFCIAVLGSNGKEFAETAATEGAGVAIDVDAIYKRLTAIVEPALGKVRQITASVILNTITQELRQIGAELGLASVPMPLYNNDMYCPTEADTLVAIRKLIEDSVGSALQRVYIESEAVEKGINEGVAASTVPVALYGTDAENVKAIAAQSFSGRYVVVDTEGKAVDNNLVVKTFNEIKEIVNPTKTKKQKTKNEEK